MHGFAFSRRSGIMNDARITKHTDAATPVAEEVRAFYERYPYPPPVDSLEKYRGAGRTDRGAARTITCSGLPDPIGKTTPSSLPAAGHPRRPSMPCVGRRRRSPASTSAQPACAVPRSSSENTNWTISRSASFPSSGSGDLETSFDQIVCTGVLHHLADPDAGLSALRECAQTGRGDASHGVCALRTDRHLHAAGILQTDRHPCHR